MGAGYRTARRRREAGRAGTAKVPAAGAAETALRQGSFVRILIKFDSRLNTIDFGILDRNKKSHVIVAAV
jgi:hypothetical protein